MSKDCSYGDSESGSASGSAWQRSSFLNCNDVHDLDLREVLNSQRRKLLLLKQKNKNENNNGNERKLVRAGERVRVHDRDGNQRQNRNGNGNGNATSTNTSKRAIYGRSNITRMDLHLESELELDHGGYLGAGMWRQVWKLQPRISGEDAVLKVMKAEHDTSPRNFDRHRRDALVMERLTKFKHVVSGYGFCGNTVLTEFAGVTLDNYLNDENRKVKRQPKGSSAHMKMNMTTTSTKTNETAKSITSIGTPRRMNKSETKINPPVKPVFVAPQKYNATINPLYKIDLALDIMRGLEAMHNINAVHADIGAKQFLMDPVEGVKLNDFNRCRLLPTNDKTGDRCKVKIPSAPGGSRSPEEYELLKIDTKIDIFSTGNILFNILTGKEPWGRGLMKLDVQKKVKKGILPEISDDFSRPGTIDAELAEIVMKAYTFKPEDRWNATKIIQELEGIRRRHAAK